MLTHGIRNLRFRAPFRGILLCLVGLLISTPLLAESFSVSSPDERNQVSVRVDQAIHYSVKRDGEVLLEPSRIGMTLKDRPNPGVQPEVQKVQRRHVDQTVTPVVPMKRDRLRNRFNELHIQFKESYALYIRAYNDGVAYRFETSFPDMITVKDETVQFSFSGNPPVHVKKEDAFQTPHEVPFSQHQLSALSSDAQYSLPTLIRAKNGPRMLVSETDLRDYPNLWFQSGNGLLRGLFPGYPRNVGSKGHVNARMNYIARTDGSRQFPWRLVMIAEEDVNLINNHLVFLLSTPNQIDDPSWIDPGFTTLDWWGKQNMFNVNFEGGMNTQTMKYYVDFCATFDIPYYLVDADWSARQNVFDVHPDVDIEEVVNFGHKKDVGIFLWVHWNNLRDEQEMNRILDQFAEWGVRGIKVDFMGNSRDDQLGVKYYHRVARAAAKRQLLVNFHGSYKPSGLRRTYPNVVAREGTLVFEWNSWGKKDTPTHRMTLPFTRLVLGPLDYVPGTLNNVQEKQFAPVEDQPMGWGTRAHSIALAILFDNGMQMIPDSPTDYERAADCTRFLSQIPVTWERTIPLSGKYGKYVALARKHGNAWYVAAATNERAREITMDFSFLDEGKHQVEYIQDGPNAHQRAIDHKHQQTIVNPSTKTILHLAPAGGWVARITPAN